MISRPDSSPLSFREGEDVSESLSDALRHQLRAIGNGGVPLCAAIAWAILALRVIRRGGRRA